ncbi:molecular chaperone DnaJ [Undibacterium sp. RuRC25W]|uniref:molecular chaperone DnaJ n=1 Tax=Undibacterium sp. RuRC25W TaxID=3413047 RepID=UPI003BF34167
MVAPLTGPIPRQRSQNAKTCNELMTLSKSNIVRIIEPKGQPTLSAGQKTFNRLIKKIDQQRQQLAEWQAMIPLYQQKQSTEFAPLLQKFNLLRKKLVELFDKSYADPTLSKTDRAKLSDILCAIAGKLLVENDDPALKSIYNMYSDTDFDAEAKEVNTAIRSIMEDVLGVELDEVDLTSSESVFEYVDEKRRQHQAHQEKNQQEYDDLRSNRKKSSKELAREARQEKEAHHVSQSIRAVFRQLASALHPDREQDPAERDRKTTLMQRVNVAYDKRDLLKLLELQLEVEQIDQSMINAISADRLKHYNKILTEQSVELQQEIEDMERDFRASFGFSPDASLSPAQVMHSLQAHIKHIQRDITMLKQDLAALRDISNLKRWLKSYRISR